MALRNQVQDAEFDIPQGLDTTSPLITMKPGFVRTAQNCRLGLSGGYSKRDGYTNQLATPYGSRDITFGIEYRLTSGVRRTIVFGTDGSPTGGQYGFVSAGAITDISTGLSGTRRPSMVQFGSLLFFFNGGESELYDGTGTRQIGVDAPTGFIDANLTPSNGAGGLVSGSDYAFAYTYYNSVTGAESSPSEVASVTLGGSDDTVTAVVVPGDSQTADKIRMYRTYANGNTLYLDGEVAVAATSYVSLVEDAGLGAQLELDNSRIGDLSSSPQYSTIVGNRIFLKSGANEARWSKIGQAGPMPESFEVQAVESTMGKFGGADDIVGMSRISQLPIVLKEKSIGRLEPIGVPDNTLAVDGVRYQYAEISDTVGAVSHWGACQVLGELVFISKDNVYATDGIRAPRPVADSIQATIQQLGFNDSQRPRVSAINDTEKKLVKISVFSSGTAADPDWVLVGDYRFYPSFRWTVDTQGTDAVTHPGKPTGCLFHVTNVTSGKQDVWFGNVKANGKVYKDESGTSDDSSGIYFNLVTRPYFMGMPLERKLYKLLEVQAQGTGSSYDLSIGSIFNLSSSEEDVDAFPLVTSASVYDDPGTLYDSATYADDAVLGIQYSMHRRAKYWQAIFRQTDSDAPVSLFAWAVEASQLRDEK